MTPVLKVLTEYCDTYVDDIRLKELLPTNPALYARKMSQYFIPAISLFEIPSEMQEYLLGTKRNPKFFEPRYDNKRYTTSEKITTPHSVELGNDFKEYELFSAQILSLNGNQIVATPTDICSYDSDKGVITINASEDNPVEENTTFDFDFYADGYFENDLSRSALKILGMCFEVVWQTRFNNDWLSNVSKVESNSFGEQNRANKTRADTERFEQLKRKLAGEMRRFEQNAEYRQVVPSDKRLKF
ncbi:MAG: hypothetical protein IJX81_01220 [Clostridia bacterium]|nr:hypothetical protein [Clostridia bacterium]